MCGTPTPKPDEDEDLVPVDPTRQRDMGVARTGLDILSSGGCKWKGEYHENGNTWHPTVLPWGEMKCITCNCKVQKNNTIAKKQIALKLFEHYNSAFNKILKIFIQINDNSVNFETPPPTPKKTHLIFIL